MGQQVREVMKGNPICLTRNTPVAEAAKHMRDDGIGDVLVCDEQGKLCGIVTDRDIVIRTIAVGKDPQSTMVGDICSNELTTLSPNDDVDKAVNMMENRAVRRIPVVEADKAVGILSIGDLALQRDRKSALAQISAAPPNT